MKNISKDNSKLEKIREFLLSRKFGLILVVLSLIIIGISLGFKFI